MNSYIKLANSNAAKARDDIFYDDYGYNLIDPGTGIRKGIEVNTFHAFVTVPHPTNATVLMIIKPIPRWHLDGTFTKESPSDLDKNGDPVKVKGGPRDGQPLMTELEKTGMKTEEEWKTEGFFPEPIL